MDNDELQKLFSNLYNKHVDEMFRHCYFRINDRNRAVDLTQEAFMRAWRYASGGKNIEQPRAFLFKVINNLIINEYERRKKTSSIDEIFEESGYQPSTDEHKETEQKLEAELVISYLDSLNSSYRDVLVMRYIDGLSVKNIAEILKENENNISVRIHRALNALKKRLREKENDANDNLS